MGDSINQESLEQLTVAELQEVFASLELKGNKGVIIQAIVEGSPTDQEIDSYESILKKKVEEAEAEAKAEAEKQPSEDYKIKRGDKFVVVHPIKEDGKRLEPGKDYTGNAAARMLKRGQIRRKDK